MAYSSDTYYTWIAKGKAGYVAIPTTYSTVQEIEPPFREYQLPFPDNYSSIHQWDDFTELWNDSTTRIDVPISGGDVSKLVFQSRGANTIWVEVYNQNNERVSSKEYGFGINENMYHTWCEYTEEGTTYGMPINLYLAAVPGTPPLGGIHFTFMSQVHPLKLVKYGGWFTDNISLYANSGGDRELQLMDELLDGVYLDPEGIAPTGGTGGGGGYYSRPDEQVGIPALPSVSACDTGFISLYSCTPGQLRSLATYMWDDSFYQTIVKLFNSPMENIISLQGIPFNPTGTEANIIIGNVDTGIQATKLSTSFYHVSCGQKNVAEYYRSFADYSPYTPAISLFLPYIGIVNLSPDDCMNGSIKIDYNIDIFSGACVAFVSCNTNGVWHVLQQHQGTLTSSYPLSGQNYMSVYRGLLGAAASVAAGSPVAAASQLMNTKPEYKRSGNVSSTAGMLGTQYPYLIFTTPQYIMAENFREVKGYTSNLKVRVGDQNGYLQATADNSELSDIPCTEEERAYIRQMLADGIYV